MANQYYLERDHKKFGPFSAAQLKKLGAASRVQSTDMVWKQGVGKGVLATHVTGLLPAAQVKDLLVRVNVAAAEVPSSPSASPSVLVTVDDSQPSYGEETPVVLRAGIVPEGLMLKAISGETDREPEVFPAPTAAKRKEILKGPTGAESSDVIKAKDATPEDKPTSGPNPSSPQKERVRKLRAGSARGATIVSQDGVFVSFKKKCFKCGLEDTVTARMPLRSGPNRTNFFCPKCRKMRDVEIQGSL